MTPNHDPTIIGMSGYAGTSKEAVAQLLCDYHDFQARPLTALVERIAAASPGWDGRRTAAARATLWAQSAALRAAFSDDILVRDALRYPLPPRLVIVGVRLETEAAAIRASGGIIVRLTRDGVGPADAHEATLCAADVEVDVTDLNAATFAVALAALRRPEGAVAP